MTTLGNTSGGWNSDCAYFPYKDSTLFTTWFKRGSGYNGSTGAGTFAYTCDNGSSYISTTSRSVITASN